MGCSLINNRETSCFRISFSAYCLLNNVFLKLQFVFLKAQNYLVCITNISGSKINISVIKTYIHKCVQHRTTSRVQISSLTKDVNATTTT